MVKLAAPNAALFVVSLHCTFHKNRPFCRLMLKESGDPFVTFFVVFNRQDPVEFVHKEQTSAVAPLSDALKLNVAALSVAFELLTGRISVTTGAVMSVVVKLKVPLRPRFPSKSLLETL